ncbi:class I SAM-dependent DNA methyltransferase, partial [Myxococcota bacterium]|nr:class I SAM-dependent DNA methyltransferase [Myxococcota bacterium]
MPLSWNEIKNRALNFSKEWKTEVSEDAEAKSFWDHFFNVFGISRRRVASFEKPVIKGDGRHGYIDLLWKGVLLVEHKSRGRDLDRAFHQALDYFPGLKERDLPRYVLVSDFARFRLYDLDEDKQHEFTLHELYLNVRRFGFIAGYEARTFGAEDPVNVKAARHLGLLHDQLYQSGYVGHPLEVLLVRLLFCMFAEDTGLFGRNLFAEYLELRTSPDGADLGMHLASLFQVLDTDEKKRQKTLDEQLQEFPYVNGQLFSEMLPIANFNREMRETLLECCALDWSRISPAVFGSLFQSIMNAKDRRAAGAHYTTETHILRLIGPLFLDDLLAEFERVKGNVNKLFEFKKRLSKIYFLDPACGCGNFLVIAYRELRKLDLEILRVLSKYKQGYTDIAAAVHVNVDQFCGIEIDEWPARIAEVALWLTDHQMNMQVSEEFGQYFARLPLVSAPRIVCANALRIDWADVVPPEKLSFILGNPPFVGAKFMSDAQRADVDLVFGATKNAGLLDFVTCWYRKAAEFMQVNSAIRAAFVSTNSITMGEQVGALWPDLFSRGVKIHFGHRTFQWSSEARGKAAVHCVIIGFGLNEVAEKWIFEYETIQSEPHAVRAK